MSSRGTPPVLTGSKVSKRISWSRKRKLVVNVRFSNRPIKVKRFQTIRRHGVDVARGLALLFGLGTKALPYEVEQSFGRPCRQCDCRFKRTYELTSSIVPRGT
jgi:hypothetical protein